MHEFSYLAEIVCIDAISMVKIWRACGAECWKEDSEVVFLGTSFLPLRRSMLVYSCEEENEQEEHDEFRRWICSGNGKLDLGNRSVNFGNRVWRIYVYSHKWEEQWYLCLVCVLNVWCIKRTVFVSWNSVCKCVFMLNTLSGKRDHWHYDC
jgi:hypothetical protein